MPITTPLTGTFHGLMTVRVTRPSGIFDSEVLTLGGLPCPELEAVSGGYRCLVDTRRYPNGPQALSYTATPTNPALDPIVHTVTITVANTLQTGVAYQTWTFENQREGQRVKSVDLGLKTYALPNANRMHFWSRLRLFTDLTPNANDVTSLTTPDALGDAFQLGQPVLPIAGKHVTPAGLRPETQARYAASQLLTYPGQTVTAMLRLDPVEVQSWWLADYDRCLKLRRVPSDTAGTEVWYALFADTSGPGGALYRFTVSGSLADPVVKFTKHLPLTADAPHPVDFCIADGKIFVLCQDATNLIVFDMDEGEQLVSLGLPHEPRPPKFLETVGDLPIVICVDPDIDPGPDEAHPIPPTQAWKLTFPSVKPLWTLADPVEKCLPGGTDAVPILALTSGPDLYTSAAGTATPVLTKTFDDDITALGQCPDYSLVGLANGDVLRPLGSGWKLLATLPHAVSAAGAWISDGERLHAVATNEGSGANILKEEGLDATETDPGSWGIGATLAPPEAMTAATIDVVTALEGFDRVVTPESGTLGQPDYIPAVKDRRLIIATGDSGLFGTLQRSNVSEADGAFLSYEHNDLYLQPYFGVVPVVEDED